MKFNKHFEIEGKHAFLSPSQYHWVNYDEEKLTDRFYSFDAKERGTRLHSLASECIKMNVKLAKSSNALNRFVNDAIGYKMESEVPLYFSQNCFGTADAISFRKNTLRIHDLKTGSTPASMIQLEIYAALFCLEYEFDPHDISIALRIYQSDDISDLVPEPDAIADLMDKIIYFDKILNDLRVEQ